MSENEKEKTAFSLRPQFTPYSSSFIYNSVTMEEKDAVDHPHTKFLTKILTKPYSCVQELQFTEPF
jgi:hypothetical protein